MYVYLPDNLLSASFVEDPRLRIRITGHTSKSQKGPILFSFTVPLPQLHSNQATLFSKAKDCPSFRGSHSRSIWDQVYDEKLHNVFTCRCSRYDTQQDSSISCQHGHLQHFEFTSTISLYQGGWSDKYTTKEASQVWNAETGILESSTTASLHSWNSRRERNIIAPWTPLGSDISSLDTDDETFLDNNSFQHSENVKQSLQDFLIHIRKEMPLSNWLIVPQIPYGWDTLRLESELNKMIPTGTLSVLNPLKRISIEMVQPKASIAVNLFSSRRVAHIHELLGKSSEIAFVGRVMGTTVALLTVASIIFFWNEHRLTGTLFLIFAAIVLAGPLLSLMLLSRPSINDSIGIAWNLNGWIPTGISESHSRSEVLQKMKEKYCNLTYFTSLDQIMVEKRVKEWYVRLGTSEQEWLDANRQILEKAIMDRYCGDLSPHPLL